MFGDAMWEEEERLRRAEDGLEDEPTAHDEPEDLMALGGLDDRLRRRQAIAQLLREVGGC